jgi:solute carrier family 25 carnitine/acylcarnitine transporter 20/29
MQTDAIDRKERKYKGWLDCVKKMYATGGVKMFFRGWTPWFVALITWCVV